MSAEEKKVAGSGVVRHGSTDVADAPKVRAVVERGRTVVVPHPTKTRIVSYSPEGKEVRQPIYLEYGPGREVELPADEVTFLRERGYLVDPNKKAPVSGTENPFVRTL